MPELFEVHDCFFCMIELTSERAMAGCGNLQWCKMTGTVVVVAGCPSRQWDSETALLLGVH